MEQSNPLFRLRSHLAHKLHYFAHLDTSGGVVLILCTIIAMIWANSPWHEAYFHLIHVEAGLHLGSFKIEHSLLHWVNDGLMVLFFFVVGLEIKRELVVGELSTLKKAALPFIGAIGGMLFPALIYFSLNPTGPAASGWGVPMATDIAFAVGVLTLLGSRVPVNLRIFLLALAVIDDLGAVMVIAIFYSSDISFGALGLAGFLLILTYLMNLAGVRHLLGYVLIGVILWFAILNSGVHATVSGVLLGLLTPTRAWFLKGLLVDHVREISDKIIASIKESEEEEERLPSETSHHIRRLRFVTKEGVAPLDRIIEDLHLWVTFLIMPVFAFFNAGVRIEGVSFSELSSNSIFLGILLGLFVGKPLGIGLISYLAVRLGWAELPKGTGWTHLLGIASLAGIGFTMALFISGLALGTGGETEVFAKTGILAGSLFAGILGSYLLFRAVNRQSAATKPS